MSAFSAYATRSERVAYRLATSSCSALMLVAQMPKPEGHDPEEDGFQVSGDMLAVKARQVYSTQARRRLAIAERLTT